MTRAWPQLSVKYFGSPTLHLRIGKSRIRSALHKTFCLVCFYALYLLYIRGYAVAVLALAPLVAYLLWCMRSDPFVSAGLRWGRGVWLLERDGRCSVITPTRRSVLTPWVMYLAYTEESQGPRGHLWLFLDSADRTQLRRLRVRLTLER